MGRIPYQSEVSALSGRSNSPLQRANTNPDAYGANLGRAMQQGGEALREVGQAAFEMDMRNIERDRKERVANSVATFDWSKQELELRNKVNSDADNYQQSVIDGYTDAVENHIKDIEDDKTRQAVRQSLMSDLPNVSSRSAQYEYTIRSTNSKDRGNEALNALQNKINLDPTQYDKFRDDGVAVIDALPNVTASLKEGMKTTWKYDSAKRRFDGMINNVKTVDDIDNIATELVGGEGQRDWQAEMLPTDYERLTNTLGSMRKSFNDSNNTNARAVLSNMEERTKSTPMLLPQDELRQMQEAVARTTDPSIKARAGRIMRNQEIIRTEGRLPPSDLRARINASNGNPGLAYPGLPVEVSDAVNSASETYGVSAALLGAMATREYGSEFAKAKKNIDALAPFKPHVAHNEIDLRNVRSDILDGLTLAGSSFGAPITLTGGTREVDKDSIFVSTLGMSATDKAKVATALVDAGFTGFSEKDGKLEVAMLAAVPKGFEDRKGKVWGGWTYLSPEVAQVLKDKGFVAGADSASINRKKIPGDPQAKVNYDAPTSILGADGKPTSSARGLFQFTNGTWLEVMRNPNVAAVTGIDPNMDDKALLALRSDPKLSTMAAAAYAKMNQKSLEQTLGRSVTDPEIYMAHFMGAGGAATFLTAYRNNPEQSAALLLPETAKANKPVFYDKGKELTVSQVYSNIAQNFTLAPSKVAYEDNQMRQAMLDAAEKKLKDYPIQQAMDSGSHVISPLQDANGFVARGSQARAVADYYTIPAEDMKPFTQDEEAALKKTISEGSVDDNIALMANIETMGSESAKGALKQIGQKEGVFAHAADLYLNGNTVVAGDIMRGQKRIQENPAITDQIGQTKQELNDTFTEATQGALYDLEPARRQTIQDATTALYIERVAAGGGNVSKFDKEVYKQAMQDVMGGQAGMPAIADINGNTTFVPRGLTAHEVETAFSRMTLDDWTRMSETGQPPRYPDGAVVNVEDIKDEVMLRAIGNGKYKVMLDDGGFLTTGERTDAGRWKYYIFVPDADYMKRVATRPSSFWGRVGAR